MSTTLVIPGPARSNLVLVVVLGVGSKGPYCMSQMHDPIGSNGSTASNELISSGEPHVSYDPISSNDPTASNDPTNSND